MASYNKLIRDMKIAVKDLHKDAHEVFVDQTPVDTGNARSKTRLQGSTIIADYAYAQRLDQGYSKQSPRGMVEPTVKWIEDELNRRLKDLKHGQ